MTHLSEHIQLRQASKSTVTLIMDTGHGGDILICQIWEYTLRKQINNVTRSLVSIVYIPTAIITGYYIFIKIISKSLPTL